jgi:hypothetical protein
MLEVYPDLKVLRSYSSRDLREVQWFLAMEIVIYEKTKWRYNDAGRMTAMFKAVLFE